MFTDNVKGTVLFGLTLIVLAYLTGCSFKLEFGYHGTTGRDDRVQTSLAPQQKGRVINVKANNYE